jgi:site-specific DNA recombinase
MKQHGSKVQARRADRGGEQRYHATRPRQLLSGLLKCGCCGSSYTVSGRDKRGVYLRCSRMVETGLCHNRRTVGLGAIERQVTEGIERHLAAPDLIAEYVSEFHRSLRELNDSSARRRSDLRHRLASAEAAIKRTVDLLLKGYPTRALKERLSELEAERMAVEADLATVTPPPIEFHPKAAESYRRKVSDLKAAPPCRGRGQQGRRLPRYSGLGRAHRDLSEGPLQTHRHRNSRQGGRAPSGLWERGALHVPKSRGVVVAGVGFEPTTFRL